MEAQKKNHESAFYAVLAAALLVAGAACWFYFSRADRAPKDSVPAAEQVDMSFLERLEGNYSMKIESEGDVNYTTAAVRKVAEGLYSIMRVTVYGPMHYSFSVSPDGQVSSEELGSGFAVYRSDIDKTTIHFEKENFLCELTR